MELKNNTNLKEVSCFENAFSIDDVVDWLLWILRYWYLFVISIIVFMSLAYLKNRKWKPIYSTAAQVIVEEKLSHNKTDVMQGFNIQSGYSNVKNQIVMFGSYDLVGRTIEKLPFEVDYYTKGRFKTTDMYKTSPIRVEAFDVNPDIWNNHEEANKINIELSNLTVEQAQQKLEKDFK